MDRFYEDFTVGDTFETPAYAVTEAASLAFAREFDPQPFHLDARAASGSFFKQLVSSGWHTAAITMRLIVESRVLEATGIIGTGIDELRWLAPVKPGDTLHVRGEVIDKAPTPNKPRGTMRVRLHTLNHEGTTVMSQIANLALPYRP